MSSDDKTKLDNSTDEATGETLVERDLDGNFKSGTPTDIEHVTNKGYVDSLIQGLDIKESVRSKTDANITLSGEQTISGVSLVSGDRVLVTEQSTTSENGIYIIDSSAWSRAEYADDGTLTSGAFTFIEEGDFEGQGWVLITNDPIDVGNDSQQWVKFSTAGQIEAGDGLTKDSNTLNVNVDDDTIEISGTDNLQLKDISGLTSGNYGASNSTIIVDVNSKGQIIDISQELIEINFSQISDGPTAIQNIVFDSDNFVDSDTIDFTVTAGDSVTADVILKPNEGLNSDASGVYIEDGNGITVDSNGVSVNLDADSGLTFSTGQLTINENIAGTGLTWDSGVLNADADALLTNTFKTLTTSDSIQDALDLIETDLDNLIEEIIAGTALSGGGTAGNITLDVNVDNETIQVNLNDELEVIPDLYAEKYQETVTVGVSQGTQTITHNLNSTRVTVEVFDSSTGEQLELAVTRTDGNTIEVSANGPSRSVNVVVIG